MNANESKTEEKYTLDVTEHVKWILSQAKEWAEENIEDVAGFLNVLRGDIPNMLDEMLESQIARDGDTGTLIDWFDCFDCARLDAADDEAAIDWSARLDHARAEVAKAKEKYAKYPNDKCLVSCIASSEAFLRSEVARAADAGFDPDGTPIF